MATLEFKPPQTAESEPKLNFLIEEAVPSLWESLTQNFKDTFFPKKLPPLVLTSKPIPVKDIWGFYNYKGKGAAFSTVTHIVVISLVILITYYLGKRVIEKPKEDVTLIAPNLDGVVLKPARTQVGGGGGGGDRDKFQAPKGNIPKPSMQQITPPAIVVRNDHPKLAVQPTVVLPPQVKLAFNAPNLGNPTAAMPSVPSNGTGSGSGIGSGNSGGIGVGSGPGVGEGRGGGTGGGVFRVGAGVSKPECTFCPDPEYSEEARKTKTSGTVILSIVVGPDGVPRDIQVVRSLGMGLDQQAIEAVSKWRFSPGKHDGIPASVQAQVEVAFRLY